MYRDLLLQTTNKAKQHIIKFMLLIRLANIRLLLKRNWLPTFHGQNDKPQQLSDPVINNCEPLTRDPRGLSRSPEKQASNVH